MTTAMLKGIRILDLSRVLAGPVCSQILADLGADVIKVESPQGDDTRQWGPPFLESWSAYFLAINRGKRSVVIDLSKTEGREVLAHLIGSSDVLLQNFLPKTAEKYGLSPASLSALNPDLVSCAISGFGGNGPWKDVPGYDFVIQALSGLMSITGPREGEPMKVGVAITDVLAGLYAAVAVLAGLVARGKVAAEPPGTPASAARPRGHHFDLSLLECTLASLVNVVQGFLVTGQPPRRYGNAHPHIVPYECFRTADGWLVVAVGNDRQWQHFCQALKQPAWGIDARFATNPARVEHREALAPMIATLLAQQSNEVWIERLTRQEVPHAPVLSLPEILNHPQIQQRGIVIETSTARGQRLALLASPIRLFEPATAQPASAPSAPPALGEHTAEVLREVLGYDTEKLRVLREKGAIR